MVSLGEVVSETRRGPLVVPGSLLGFERSAKHASALGSDNGDCWLGVVKRKRHAPEPPRPQNRPFPSSLGQSLL